MCMCIDYRVENEVTQKDKYPLLQIADCLDQLSSATVFSKIDLLQGYHQMHLVVAHIPKMSLAAAMDISSGLFFYLALLMPPPLSSAS